MESNTISMTIKRQLPVFHISTSENKSFSKLVNLAPTKCQKLGCYQGEHCREGSQRWKIRFHTITLSVKYLLIEWTKEWSTLTVSNNEKRKKLCGVIGKAEGGNMTGILPCSKMGCGWVMLLICGMIRDKTGHGVLISSQFYKIFPVHGRYIILNRFNSINT